MKFIYLLFALFCPMQNTFGLESRLDQANELSQGFLDIIRELQNEVLQKDTTIAEQSTRIAALRNMLSEPCNETRRMAANEEKTHITRQDVQDMIRQAMESSEAKNKALEKENEELKERINGVMASVYSNSQTIEDIGTRLTPEYGLRAATVFFIAYTNRDQNQVPLAFYTNVTNIGRHYDTSRGKFTCPVSGLYVFSVITRSPPCRRMTVRIMRGDHQIAKTSDKGGSLTAITECQASDSVYAAGHLWCHDEGSNSTQYSSFSGLLLVSF